MGSELIKSLDMNLLIEEIRKRPGLWNELRTNFRDKDVKTQLWEEVCLALFSDFNSMGDSKKCEIDERVRNKWKNLKDNYVKAAKYGNRLKFKHDLYFWYKVHVEAAQNRATSKYGKDSKIHKKMKNLEKMKKYTVQKNNKNNNIIIKKKDSGVVVKRKYQRRKVNPVIKQTLASKCDSPQTEEEFEIENPHAEKGSHSVTYQTNYREQNKKVNPSEVNIDASLIESEREIPNYHAKENIEISNHQSEEENKSVRNQNRHRLMSTIRRYTPYVKLSHINPSREQNTYRTEPRFPNTGLKEMTESVSYHDHPKSQSTFDKVIGYKHREGDSAREENPKVTEHERENENNPFQREMCETFCKCIMVELNKLPFDEMLKAHCEINEVIKKHLYSKTIVKNEPIDQSSCETEKEESREKPKQNEELVLRDKSDLAQVLVPEAKDNHESMKISKLPADKLREQPEPKEKLVFGDRPEFTRVLAPEARDKHEPMEYPKFTDKLSEKPETNKELMFRVRADLTRVLVPEARDKHEPMEFPRLTEKLSERPETNKGLMLRVRPDLTRVLVPETTDKHEPMEFPRLTEKLSEKPETNKGLMLRVRPDLTRVLVPEATDKPELMEFPKLTDKLSEKPEPNEVHERRKVLKPNEVFKPMVTFNPNKVFKSMEVLERATNSMERSTCIDMPKSMEWSNCMEMTNPIERSNSMDVHMENLQLETTDEIVINNSKEQETVIHYSIQKCADVN